MAIMISQLDSIKLVPQFLPAGVLIVAAPFFDFSYSQTLEDGVGQVSY